MSDEPLLPVYLIGGSDRPKVRRALGRLKGRFGEQAVETLAADSTSGADAVAAANALGLFGEEGGKLVVVEGVERWKAEDADAVVAYLADPVPGSVLALVAEEALRSSKLPDACTRAGGLLTYDVPKPRDPTAWVRAELERQQLRFDGDVPRALIDVVGVDVTALATEVEKLAAWAGDDPLTRRDVEALAAPAHEESDWALTDAWGARDLAATLVACERALEHGADPFLTSIRLASYVGLVGQVRRLAEEGLGAREIAKKLRKHEFRVRKALGHSENYSREELDAAVVRLAALDAALKGASRLAGELELERAVVELVRIAEPARAS